MQKYYVSKQGQPTGPWSVDEILKNLQQNQILWTDYLYDESKQEWVVLMQHPSVSSHFKASDRPTHPPLKTEESKQEPKGDKEWFALKGENKYGPFTFFEVLRMLQTKTLFEYDYVWNLRFSEWKRVSECDEFKPDRIRDLKKSGVEEIEEVFFRRRHVRARYGMSVVVHNSKSVWKGESIEISSGGCGLMIQTHDLMPGQSLFLHFQPGDGVPPFNALCQVVNKQGPRPGQPWTKYGVKFTSINRNVQMAIKEFTDKAAA